MAISSIEKNGLHYDLYDEKGKKYKSILINNIGEVIGFSSDFFIAIKGFHYELYDVEGKKYKSISLVSR